MAARPFRSYAGALAFALLVPAPAALASNAPLRSPPRGEETATLERMRGVIAGASDVLVTHSTSWFDPVSFETQAPCRRMTPGSESARWLDAGWAQRFAACLRLDSLAGAGEGGCEGDAARLDRVRLEFRQGSQKVTVAANLGRGDLYLTAGETLVSRVLGARTPGLRALLAEALPDDSLLAGAVVCDGSHPSSPDCADEPAFGSYVYVEELPEAVRKVPPAYPAEAREDGVSGQVVVQALVGRDGRVHRMVIVDSIPLLDGAAAAAVEQWKFRPARSYGEPVVVWVAIPVKFTLR